MAVLPSVVGMARLASAARSGPLAPAGAVGQPVSFGSPVQLADALAGEQEADVPKTLPTL
jgi:hypothetical protein